MQTNYSLFPGVARAGSLYDVGPKDVVTRTSSAAIPFGSFVVKDIGDGNVLLPSAGPSGGPAFARPPSTMAGIVTLVIKITFKAFAGEICPTSI